jgi:putative aminopeptidase FrvX
MKIPDDPEMLREMSALLGKLTEVGYVSRSMVSAGKIDIELTEKGRGYLGLLDHLIGGSEKRIRCMEMLLDIVVRKQDSDDPR